MWLILVIISSSLPIVVLISTCNAQVFFFAQGNGLSYFFLNQCVLSHFYFNLHFSVLFLNLSFFFLSLTLWILLYCELPIHIFGPFAVGSCFINVE